MKQVQIINQTSPFEGRLVAGYCSSFLCRLKGLMFRRGIPKNWGLLLVESKDSIANAAIHMLFVPFDLGIIWVNGRGEVVDTALAKSWVGLKSPQKPARFILEVQPQHLEKFHPGDSVDFVEI